MSINKTYAVFGLGRYGKAVAEELVKNGAEVLGVDVDQDIVDNAVETIPVCKCADITEAEVIKRLGISNMDIVIVSMANNLEASVMAVTLCKEAGVETVIAKCASEMQEKILKRVGADRVVFPERESGIRLGRNLITSGFSEMIELSKEVSMIEMDVKTEWTVPLRIPEGAANTAFSMEKHTKEKDIRQNRVSIWQSNGDDKAAAYTAAAFACL